MSNGNVSRGVLIGLVVIALLLLWAIILPFAKALFLAAVLAGVLYPSSERLAGRLRGRRSLAAGLITVAAVLLLIVPVGAVGVAVGKEVVNGVNYVRQTLQSQGVAGLIHDLPAPLQGLARKLVDQLPGGEPQLEDLSMAQGGRAVAAARGVLTATTTALLQLVMMLIAFYFLLRDGGKLVDWICETAPLQDDHARALLADFRKVSVTVIVSSLATAAFQALVALAGYILAGVPEPFFFMFVTFISAFVPAVGATGVAVATAVLLFLTGHTGPAVFLAVWAVLVVGLVDNFLKPWLMRGRMEIHGGIIFFALLGGLATFGMIGLLAGPLIVAFFLSVVRMCRREFEVR